MYTDIVGYTSLTEKSEALAMQLLEMHRSVVRPFFPKYNGREVKTMGDAFLVEFASALEAVRCAYDIQQSMRELNEGRSPEKQIQLRIGVHVGDVIHRENDVYGDAVNVASRIYPFAAPGGVCLSQPVYEHVKNKFEFPMVSLGKKEVKNVSEPIEVYKVAMPWDKVMEAQATTFPANRIAILPFVSMSTNPDDAFFADGVTEEIISTASGISGLEVISRTSVMGYKGTTKKVKEIGRELEAGSVLEGSFRKSGDRIRVTTQLIDVAKDRHLWAQNYDRNLDDIFEVQSDVAKQVAEALRVRILSPEKERIEKKPTESTAAYTHYLRGRQLWNKRTLNDVREALTYFERAVKEDPNFALGYVGQADCYLVAPLVPTDIEAIEMAKPLVSKALELDPDLAEAHTTHGMVLASEYELRQAEEEYRKAIELKPSYATAHQWYFIMLQNQLRWEEALKEIEKAVELDPLSPVISANHGDLYLNRKDFGKAIELYRRLTELIPSNPSGHFGLAFSYGMARMFDEMKQEYDKYVELSSSIYPLTRVLVEAEIAFHRDDKEAIRRLLPELETHLQEAGVDASGIAWLYFFLGENDKGFEWLERSYSRREYGLARIQFWWTLDTLARTDPRYLGFMKRLGLD